MAIYTGFSVGVVRNAVAYIPVETLIKAGVNRICMFDRTWQRLMSQNRQPQMLNEEFKQKARQLIEKKREDRKDLFDRIIEGVKANQSGEVARLNREAAQQEIDNA